jgi:hypothetical protein
VRIVAVAVVLIALVAPPVGSLAAQPAAVKLAAIVGGSDDVRRTILVGSSAQIWEPDGTGTWTRRSAGGVAADVTGANLGAGDIHVAGKATPMYRRKGGIWYAVRFGAKGRTLLASGRALAVAVDRVVFVQAGAWKRLAVANAPIKALYVASEREAVLATAAGLWRLRGRSFVPVPGSPGMAVTALVGAKPGVAWALTASGGLVEVGRVARAIPVVVAGEPLAVSRIAAAPDGSVWVIGRKAGAGGPPVLAHRTGTGFVAVATGLAADAEIEGLVVDRAGRVLLADAHGGVQWRDEAGTWTAAVRVDALPQPIPGKGPARSN